MADYKLKVRKTQHITLQHGYDFATLSFNYQLLEDRFH